MGLVHVFPTLLFLFELCILGALASDCFKLSIHVAVWFFIFFIYCICSMIFHFLYCFCCSFWRIFRTYQEFPSSSSWRYVDSYSLSTWRLLSENNFHIIFHSFHLIPVHFIHLFCSPGTRLLVWPCYLQSQDWDLWHSRTYTSCQKCLHPSWFRWQITCWPWRRDATTFIFGSCKSWSIARYSILLLFFMKFRTNNNQSTWHFLHLQYIGMLDWHHHYLNKCIVKVQLFVNR